MNSKSILRPSASAFRSRPSRQKSHLLKAFISFTASIAIISAWHIFYGSDRDVKAALSAFLFQIPFRSCENTPDSRRCWGEYSVDTNYITTIPDTGNTVEAWLSAEESICSPDGYERSCKTFNGTMPGPAITANWGDELIIHVTNNLKSNGTTVHWHGVRQLGTVQYDGVPGVTQCPISPGETMTYRYKVSQYGSSWYHSHISLQYSEGMFGPLIFHGPATADYDEDLGVLFLQDWSHTPAFSAWEHKIKYGITHSLDTLLINGTNTFNCTNTEDSNCVGGGTKFQTVFEPGRRYLMRLVNTGTDSQFQFSIDGHKLKVIANDFVPIQPYITDSVIINAAQRYDVIVEASAASDNYWLRAYWVDACAGVANDHPEDSTGIVRYDATSTQDPTSVSVVQPPTVCGDEPLQNLVPHVPFDITNVAGITTEELRVVFNHAALFTWTINSSSLSLDWNHPTLERVYNNESVFPTEYNVVSVDKRSASENEWAILVIQNKVMGLLGAITHPIHLHGHDFWILAQKSGAWDGTTDGFMMTNPPRRDTAVLPALGHLAIAFRLDNPGTWLLHCHIVWHASQGLALEFVESEDSIRVHPKDMGRAQELCDAWSDWSSNSTYPRDGSGI